MTTKTELQEQLNTLLDRANDLENLINAMPNEEQPFPQKGDTYWILGRNGIGAFSYDGKSFDKCIQKRQKIYSTESDALKADEQRMAVIEVNRQAQAIIDRNYPDWVCDWGVSLQPKYCPTYNHEITKIEISGSNYIQKQDKFIHAPAAKVWKQVDQDLLLIALGHGD
jgi:hypothetical protein